MDVVIVGDDYELDVAPLVVVELVAHEHGATLFGIQHAGNVANGLHKVFVERFEQVKLRGRRIDGVVRAAEVALDNGLRALDHADGEDADSDGEDDKDG